MNIRKINKTINRVYHKNNIQHLYIETMEVMDGVHDCSFDVCIADDKDGMYLFTVQNYNAFIGFEIVLDSPFRPLIHFETWDSIQAACVPLYMDQTYTLKTFKNITKKDIEACAKHFCRKVLDNYWIWNISFPPEKELNKESIECIEHGK